MSQSHTQLWPVGPGCFVRRVNGCPGQGDSSTSTAQASNQASTSSTGMVIAAGSGSHK